MSETMAEKISRATLPVSSLDLSQVAQVAKSRCSVSGLTPAKLKVCLVQRQSTR